MKIGRADLAAFTVTGVVLIFCGRGLTLRNAPSPLEGTFVPRFVRPVLLAPFGLGIAVILAACMGGSARTEPPAASLPAGTFAVEAKEYSFTPSTLTVPAGEVTFQVKNSGQEEHEFKIFQGDTVVGEVEGLVPGLTKDLKVPLVTGEYQFKCLLNGHDQLGMTGTLTVTGS
jgi:iron uptake system component EfeO